MVWNGHEAVVVEQVQSPKQVKHTAAVGTRYDTYQSASVQVFLAALPAAEVHRLFDRRLLAGTTTSTPSTAYVAELPRRRAWVRRQRRPHVGRGGGRGRPGP